MAGDNPQINNTVSVDLHNFGISEPFHYTAASNTLTSHYKYIDLYNRVTYVPTTNYDTRGRVIYRYYYIFARFINYGDTNTNLPPRILLYSLDTNRPRGSTYRILADSYYYGGNYRNTVRSDIVLPTTSNPVNFKFAVQDNYLAAYWNDKLIVDKLLTSVDFDNSDLRQSESFFDDSANFMRRQQVSLSLIHI